jgi:hypothetical protein
MRQKFRYPCVASLQAMRWRDKGEVWDIGTGKWVKFVSDKDYVGANIEYTRQKYEISRK